MRKILSRVAVLCGIVALCGILSAAVAGAAPAPPAAKSFDQPPLLLVHWQTDTIAGQIIDTSVVIHAGGATEITEIKDGAPARMLRGIASDLDFRALQAALVTGQVISERGGCGNPMPDGAVSYDVTWYGAGSRFNTFTVGADLLGCAPGLRALFETFQKLVNDVRPAPGTQAFPRPR